MSDNTENEAFDTYESEACTGSYDKVTINIVARTGQLVKWLGVRSVGEDPTCDKTTRTLWLYGSDKKVVPL